MNILPASWRPSQFSKLFKRKPQPAAPDKRVKGIYIGAPACFKLELACKHVHAAFCTDAKFAGMYVVGSCLERPDWRDIDIRLMIDDAGFRKLFPMAHLTNASWEFDHRWALMSSMISTWLSAQSGLPVDFQFQPMGFANQWHKKHRSAIGMNYCKPDDFDGNLPPDKDDD